MKGNANGFILPSTLMLIVVLGLFASHLHYRQYATIVALQDRIHSFKSFEKAKSEPVSEDEALFGTLRAVTYKAQAGKHRNKVTLLLNKSDSRLLPDFNRLFQDPFPCPDLDEQQLPLTRTGDRLTPTAYYSQITCYAVDILKDRNIYALRSNIDLEAMISSESDRKSPLILVSTGFVSIKKLPVTENISIYAAGDIFIDTLVLNESRVFQAISSSGVVIVKSVEGDGGINATAAEGVFLPAHVLHRPVKNGVFLRDKVLLGIR